MGNRRLGAALVIMVAVLAAAFGLWVSSSGGASTQAGSDNPPSATVVTAVPSVQQAPRGAERDGPPNYTDNRGHLQPRTLTPETRAVLDTKAAEIRESLERLRGEELPGAAKVRETLVGLGYPVDSVYTEDFQAAQGERAVVFGISTSGGCVKGDMRPTETRVQVDGLIPEWGCREPKTH